ncbi:MAG: dienelactone hydrolase family protein [Bacteroidota bacterium]
MKFQHLRNSLILSVIMMVNNSFAQSNGMTPGIREENISYQSDGMALSGFVAFDENVKGTRPVVLIVHEWWGLNDYSKARARQLAELGYLAMAVDMFGQGKIAANPKEAQELTKPFYTDPKLGKSRLDAAIKKIKENPRADKAKIAAIGYCFGGSVVLNAAKLGAGLKGVVCFHGGLAGVAADQKLLKAKILVCNGASDKFVSQQDVNAFKRQMDSIGAVYTFKSYANATHAFTNPDATRLGKEFNLPIEYNAEADHDSWNDMKTFLSGIFAK